MDLKRVITRPLTGTGLFIGQVLTAAHRPDLPGLDNQDPSGTFGRADAPTLRWVVLGDSSVTAPGVEPLDHCWVRRVAHRLSDRYRVEVRSVAVGGSKARDVLRDQLGPALARPADLAIVSVGANDALRATPISRFEREMDEIVRSLRDQIPVVGLCGVGDLGTIRRLPALARSLSRVRARAIDHAIRRVSSRNPGVPKTLTWGALWEPFADAESGVFAADLFHASAEGHAVFAASVHPMVESLVSRLAPGLSARQGRHESST